MQEKGFFYITTVIDGNEQQVKCGKTKDDVRQKLDDLNKQTVAENPTEIKTIYYVTIFGEKRKYKIVSDGTVILDFVRAK